MQFPPSTPMASKRTVCLGRMSFRTQGTCQEGRQQGHPPAARLVAGAAAWVLGRGPGADPAGALGLSLPVSRARGCTAGWPDPRSPGTGSSHWPHWAQPLLAVGCQPGRRGQGECLAAPSLFPEAVGKPWAREVVWPGTAAGLGQDCPAGCALFMRHSVFICGPLAGWHRTQTRSCRPGNRGGGC